MNLPSFPEFTLSDYDVCGDGRCDCTEAFRTAVEHCTAAGGGTIRVPAGRWLTGPIHLASNITLHLEEEATVLFKTDPSAYLPVVFTRWEGCECYNYSPFIYARDARNVCVTGKGSFDGQGESWWGWKKQRQQAAANRLVNAEHDGIAVADRVFGTEDDALRPSFLQFINCHDVTIEGVTFHNGPQWTLHPVYCENVTIRAVSCLTEGPNTDGLNPDSCSNVLVEDCFFSTGDDCIAINSGINEDGWRVARPCENIVIRRCRMERGHGGIVIGSGMSGGVRQVRASDCTMNGTDVGIRLKSMRGRGGYVQDVVFENIRMGSIRKDALLVNLFYGASTVVPTSERPPAFENLTFRGIRCDRADQAIRLIGLSESPVQSVTLADIDITARAGMDVADIRQLAMTNVNVRTADGEADSP